MRSHLSWALGGVTVTQPSFRPEGWKLCASQAANSEEMRLSSCALNVALGVVPHPCVEPDAAFFELRLCVVYFCRVLHRSQTRPCSRLPWTAPQPFSVQARRLWWPAALCGHQAAYIFILPSAYIAGANIQHLSRALSLDPSVPAAGDSVVGTCNGGS